MQMKQGVGYYFSSGLSNLSADTEAVVTIPVAAASESENIYKTLSLYSRQGEVAQKTTLLLHVNWFDEAETDPVKRAKINKTISEIERARLDFPDLRIADFETKWSAEKQKNGEYGNGIIGHVTQRLYDTAMMSVEKAMRERRMPSKEIMLIRNDADVEGQRRSVSRENATRL